MITYNTPRCPGKSWVQEMYTLQNDISCRMFDTWFVIATPGERDPWQDRIWWKREPLEDDGGGPAIAAYQFGLCPFAPLQPSVAQIKSWPEELGDPIVIGIDWGREE